MIAVPYFEPVDWDKEVQRETLHLRNYCSKETERFWEFQVAEKPWILQLSEHRMTPIFARTFDLWAMPNGYPPPREVVHVPYPPHYPPVTLLSVQQHYPNTQDFPDSIRLVRSPDGFQMPYRCFSLPQAPFWNIVDSLPRRLDLIAEVDPRVSSLPTMQEAAMGVISSNTLLLDSTFTQWIRSLLAAVDTLWRTGDATDDHGTSLPRPEEAP